MDTQTVVAEMKITSGPCKADLEKALFDGSTSAGRNVGGIRYVTFIAFAGEVKKFVEVAVNSVGREDGSGESWLVDGYVVTIDGKPVGSGKNYHAYYHTQNRRGYIKFLEENPFAWLGIDPNRNKGI
ncbi:MAG: hypothetical protein Q8P91_03125 [bacterium]|nr:hypothetical protein [bacterium]